MSKVEPERLESLRTQMNSAAQVLTERYRCPDVVGDFTISHKLSDDSGFFSFGGIICYGQSASGYLSSRTSSKLYDLAQDVDCNTSEIRLPFDPAQIVENLRLERYVGSESRSRVFAKKAYYAVRPILPRTVIKGIQRWNVKGWERRMFPKWPVDLSIEFLHERLLLLVLEKSGLSQIPFIWFWPDGFASCAVMTHDVETSVGKAHCSELMDVDDEFGVKASFNVVPEGNYSVEREYLDSIRIRGFEIGIQDWNHDGRLFDDREEFLRRARLINEYGTQYGAKGFRAAVLYRKPDWFDALKFSFDMSIPNTGHLDPQCGGCCTVLPYFIGDVLEIPVTTTQDYMLLHILRDNSIELWKQQIQLILESNGLMSFIVHPDYLIHKQLQFQYRQLLAHLKEVRTAKKIWIALPSEVDQWWRARNRMEVVKDGERWRIEGESSERAMLAYARIMDGRLAYELDSGATYSRPSARG